MKRAILSGLLIGAAHAHETAPEGARETEPSRCAPAAVIAVPVDCERGRSRSGDERETVSTQPGPLGSIEFAIGLSSSVRGVTVVDEQGHVEDLETSATLAVIPSIEWPLGSVLYFGLEVAFLSVDDPFAAQAGRRAITSPGAHLRMSFPVFEDVTFDAVFGAAAAFWSSDGETSLLGWNRRIALGGAYRMSEDFWLFGSLGTFAANALPEGDGAASNTISETQAVTADSLLLSAGIRSGL